ncbi:uncharacterized protein FPRO_15912 [Fusarium proliferatum ET1]|uniref:Fungal STAND N-terminal Goodbye domain-containing protein n=1 Tax=Fusarium proliferatum (strain ET1) TaxID=1227346 RepID=A0A1L7WAB1_FUSPR|nr:uncharacterized protein FPRO_15912 [Fusarium proliferatum ET1]CZR49553.1 uncharacterized protein FPRO_15912 [Fusarium proliferatum ET1]
MDKFKKTDALKRPRDINYDIRGKQDWADVYDVLESARNKYREKGGTVGWLRSVRRKVADNITPGIGVTKIASKVASNEPTATPVLGAVEILLDAIQTASRFREKVLTGFDGLIDVFSDVELFLGTFPQDEGIRNASLDLTVAVLCAIEQAIRFFLRNEFLKGGRAILSGSDYEKDLSESLDDISSKSRGLLQEATKSHIHEFHLYSQETQNMRRQLSDVVTAVNSMHDLLSEHVKQKQELEMCQQEVLRLHVENVYFRTNSPRPQIHSTESLSPLPAIEWNMSQDQLRSLLDHADLDLDDMAFVAGRKHQLPEREIVRTEQIIETKLFQEWIISAFSSKLLVQWDTCPPESVAGISSLSVFSLTMTEILRCRDRFISGLWICGLHTDDSETGARIGGRAMLTSLIDQLLRQFAFDMRRLQSEINVSNIQHGSLDEVLDLLKWLVCALPSNLTFVVIADGVALYERPNLWRDAFKVFARLLSLCNDSTVAVTMKVLLISTPGTDYIRQAFEREDLILSVDGLPQMAWSTSEERVARALNSSIV